MVANYSNEMWHQLNFEAGIDESKFELTNNYPIGDINAIIERASFHTGKTRSHLQETFGEFLVPDLFKLYKSCLDPDWKTFDV